MGYDVHITRASDWAENKGHEISAQEWLEVIKHDPDLIPNPENGDYFVVWKGANKYPETWFDWRNGNISTKYPDGATFLKFYEIAQKLHAQIQGDDGEIYDAPDIENFDDSYLDNKANSSKIGKSEKGIINWIKRLLKNSKM